MPNERVAPKKREINFEPHHTDGAFNLGLNGRAYPGDGTFPERYQYGRYVHWQRAVNYAAKANQKSPEMPSILAGFTPPTLDSILDRPKSRWLR